MVSCPVTSPADRLYSESKKRFSRDYSESLNVRFSKFKSEMQ
jgi:hypothetical protein